MLKTITKKITDRSTDRFFVFSFYCDRCGKEWSSEKYPFEHFFSEELTTEERKAKDIMWRVDHDAAFERANLEARLHFNFCESCEGVICDECLTILEEE